MSSLDWIAQRGIRAGLRMGLKLGGQLPLDLELLRAGMNATARLFRPRRECEVSVTCMDGVRVTEVVTNNPHPEHVVVLMHGGAFFAGSAATHVAFAAEIAVRANARVVLPDYRLAPEHTFPAAQEDGLSVVRALLAQGVSPAELCFCGDSAGAAIALGMALALKEAGMAQPASLVLISPFVDLRLQAPSVRANSKLDPMLSYTPLMRGAQSYCGQIPLGDARVSPLFADLRELAPMLIQCGSDEILLDDALALTHAAKSAGLVVESEVYQGMWHDFQLFAPWIDAADKALWAIAEFIRRH
ncbi:MAG TPA: alpha/beta hydrolase [Limnobacter sp.]|nr:alpha/beta hydrolase [Limnobacter sp.]